KLLETTNRTADARARASVCSSPLCGRLRSTPKQRRHFAVLPSGISGSCWTRSQSWQATKRMAAHSLVVFVAAQIVDAGLRRVAARAVGIQPVGSLPETRARAGGGRG